MKLGVNIFRVDWTNSEHLFWNQKLSFLKILCQFFDSDFVEPLCWNRPQGLSTEGLIAEDEKQVCWTTAHTEEPDCREKGRKAARREPNNHRVCVGGAKVLSLYKDSFTC